MMKKKHTCGRENCQLCQSDQRIDRWLVVGLFGAGVAGAIYLTVFLDLRTFAWSLVAVTL